MEAAIQDTQASKIIDNYQQIVAGLNQYYQDRTKIQVWTKIFWDIDVYIGKEGPLSTEAQKYINFYLQNKAETSHLSMLVSQHKQIICKVHDICLSNHQSIDEAISKGIIIQVLNKKLPKSFQQQPHSHLILKLLNYCFMAVALHFNQFLRKFYLANGQNAWLTNRRISKNLNRRNLCFRSNQQFFREVVSEPVVLLEGFLDSIKITIWNYLTMEFLFQLTSKNFKDKKAFISGFIGHNDNTKQFTGKMVNLNTIFDSSYTGREMIENKLNTLCLNNQQQNSKQKWSIISCITQIEHIILSITQKLPIFLNPRSNGDILSFCQKKFTPTFKYQVCKPGYMQRPILTQFMQVFLNIGKNHFEILSFSFTKQMSKQLQKYQNSNIVDIIDKLGIKYSKICVGPKAIGVVPSNNFYILMSEGDDKNGYNQIIFWQVLPKYKQVLSPALECITFKQSYYWGYFVPQIEHTLFSFLNHEYLNYSNNPEFLHKIVQYLSVQLREQEIFLSRHLKNNQSINLAYCEFNYSHRFCAHCRASFVNYCCKIASRKQYICMHCSMNAKNSLNQADKIQDIFIFYPPNHLRYPLTLAKIFINTKKHPSQKIENPYEKSICCNEFSGSVEIQLCKGEQHKNTKPIQSSPINLDKKQQLYFSNRSKQLKIQSLQQNLIELSLLKPKNEQQRKSIEQKIRLYAKEVSKNEESGENIKKQICSKYDSSNLVMFTMWQVSVAGLKS